ncbi:hypothetical protein [Streptomyces sp. x-80]|uniref:hypothetical protein n=1 Tax=Streptomyces sp. x-80 TaxID=2789282 RepID=UPI0039804D9C
MRAACAPAASGRALAERREGQAQEREAAEALGGALRAAAISWPVRAVDIPSVSVVTVGVGGADEAHRLAALIRENLPEPYAAAEALRVALDSLGVRAAGLRLRGGWVDIGHITLADGEVLCDVLGVPQPGCDPWDWHQIEALALTLGKAVRSVVGQSIDADFTPSCDACQRKPAIELGGLPPESARRLAAKLTGTAAS